MVSGEFRKVSPNGYFFVNVVNKSTDGVIHIDMKLVAALLKRVKMTFFG